MIRRVFLLFLVLILTWIPENFYSHYDNPGFSATLILLIFSSLILVYLDFGKFMKVKSKSQLNFKVPLILISAYFIFLAIGYLYSIFNNGINTSMSKVGAALALGTTLSMITFLIGHMMIGGKMYTHPQLRLHAFIMVCSPVSIFGAVIYDIVQWNLDANFAQLVSDISSTLILISFFSLYVTYDHKSISYHDEEILDSIDEA